MGLAGRHSRAAVRAVWPGLAACGVVAAAAAFVSGHHGVPLMLSALLLGLAMNVLGSEGACRPGIDFVSRHGLRWGVALLGLRITVGEVAALGWGTAAVVVLAVPSTIAVSVIAARLCRFQPSFGLLTGGATAICGASAALALAAALPAHPLKERATLLTVVGVSVLSTLAMIVYPILARAFGLDDRTAGIFLGATIHDVAQVVGAGYSVSREAGDVATVVKLMRVAMLVPVVLLVALWSRRAPGAPDGPRPPWLPGFALGFAALVAINSTGWLPAAVTEAGGDLSRWLLVAAIAALGMKTPLRELASVGWKPVLLLVGETVFLALLVLVLLTVAPQPATSSVS